MKPMTTKQRLLRHRYGQALAAEKRAKNPEFKALWRRIASEIQKLRFPIGGTP